MLKNIIVPTRIPKINSKIIKYHNYQSIQHHMKSHILNDQYRYVSNQSNSQINEPVDKIKNAVDVELKKKDEILLELLKINSVLENNNKLKKEKKFEEKIKELEQIKEKNAVIIEKKKDELVAVRFIVTFYILFFCLFIP